MDLGGGGLVEMSELIGGQADIPPAAASHETTGAAEGEAKGNGGSDAIEQSNQAEAAGEAEGEDGGGTENKPTIENEAVAFPDFEGLPEREIGVEEPGEKSGAEDSRDGEDEREVIEVARFNAEKGGAPTGQQPAKKETQQHQDRIRTDVRVKRKGRFHRRPSTRTNTPQTPFNETGQSHTEDQLAFTRCLMISNPTECTTVGGTGRVKAAKSRAVWPDAS